MCIFRNLFCKQNKKYDLPDNIKPLKQFYETETIIQCGHLDGYIEINKKNLFTGKGVFYGNIIFTINNDSFKINALLLYIDLLKSTESYIHPTDITLGQFGYTSERITSIEPINENSDYGKELSLFLTKNNISKDDIIAKLKQQFITAYFK